MWRIMWRKKLICILLLFLLPIAASAALTVHFIDAGQGDSILIQGPDAAVLIDGGDGSSAAYIIRYIRAQGIRRLDAVISTHPHADHIGGLIDILQAFPVGAVYDSGRPHTTRTYYAYLQTIDRLNIPYRTPRRGDRIRAGSLEFQVLHPYGNVETLHLNNASIVCRLVYGNTTFLFSGDAENQAEQAIRRSGLPLQADVLKVAHHGSRTSSSRAFINAVRPSIAVIQAGRNNRYNHPHMETLDTLKAHGVQIFRTDHHGTVVVRSDGTKLHVDVSRHYQAAAVSRININTATQAQLETLPGIGPVLAARIIAYRRQHGRYRNTSDIQKVNGIGRGKYGQIRDRISTD